MARRWAMTKWQPRVSFLTGRRGRLRFPPTSTPVGTPKTKAPKPSKLVVPALLGLGAFVFGVPTGVDVGGNLKRPRRPVKKLTRGCHFVIAQRRRSEERRGGKE